MTKLSAEALNQIFLTARTHNKWQAKDVPDSLLVELTDIMKMGPTSANCSPARLVFVKSAEAKARLLPHVSEGNKAKVEAAPVTVIIGADYAFYDHLHKLFPHADARSWFIGDTYRNDAMIDATAFRNSSLQGAYLIIAARALGLDTGPMSGFNQAGVDAEFFAGTPIKSNFICALGYGDPAGLFPRSPRFAFDDYCTVL